MHPYVLSNDEIVRSDEKILLPGQLGLLAGWGVFTTLRIYEGVPFAFERHWQRMECQGRSKFGPFRRSKSRPVGEGVAVFVGRLERSLRSPFRAAQA